MANTDTKKVKSRSYVQSALYYVGMAQQGIFTFVYGAYTKPAFITTVLATVAGPAIFGIALALQLFKFGLLVADYALTKEMSKAERSERRRALAQEGLFTLLITAAVVGSIVFTPIFTAAIGALVGGLTPLLFTIGTGFMAVIDLGKSVYNFYKGMTSETPGVRSNYLTKAKNFAVGGAVSSVLTVATALLMLSPVTGPLMPIIASISIVAMVSGVAYQHRHGIAALFGKVKKSLGSMFRSSQSAGSKLDKSLKYDQKRPLIQEVEQEAAFMPATQADVVVDQEWVRPISDAPTLSDNRFSTLYREPTQVDKISDLAFSTASPAP